MCRGCRVLRELVYCSSTVLQPETRAILLAECSPRLRISSVPLSYDYNHGYFCDDDYNHGYYYDYDDDDYDSEW